MKPSLAKGTRDFTAQEVYRRKYIINILQKNFELFGFQPLETPSFENLSTLTGKYGEEGDRLIFKILNSGDYYSKFTKLQVVLTNEILKNVIFWNIENEFDIENFSSLDEIYDKIYDFNKIRKEIKSLNSQSYTEDEIKNFHDDDNFKLSITIAMESNITKFADISRSIKLENRNDLKEKEYEILTNISYEIVGRWNFLSNSKVIEKQISEKALRYDLTVPFARYVAMNQGQINFPFKRYQIQPVWRADRPQKGRYREFYQCDADVVGSTSLWQEVELVQLYFKSFKELDIPVSIHMNNRKILSGLAEYAGISEQLIDFTVALDKLDKIGKDGVIKEMLEKNISQEAIDKIDFLFNQNDDALENLLQLKEKFAEVEIGLQGVDELEFVILNARDLGVDASSLVFNITLARGLDYYTGAIFEVKADGVEMGSIGGGGRYDNLTEVFGVKDIPGIGISFGLDRTYLVMEELGLFPENATTRTQYLFANYGQAEALEALRLVAKLRTKNIAAEIYPDAAKIKKQFLYADKKGIKNLIFLGEEEIKNNTITIKNIVSGEQKTVRQEDFFKMDL